MTSSLLLVVALAALAPVAGAAEQPGIVVEGGTIAALNSTADLGLALSVGAELPKWVPLIGEHLGFLDLLTVNTKQAIGLSVSIQRAETDDGWRLGATVTQPGDGQREVTAYVRFGVGIRF